MSTPQLLSKDERTFTPGASSLPEVGPNRFALNFASNFAYMVLSTALMLWYIPFLIDGLGVAAYGMVPLANSLVMFTAILASSLDVSINRFLAIDLNRGDFAAANRTFNTSLTLSLLASAVLLAIGLVIIWLFPALFQVPAGLENQTRLLFGAVLLNSLATMVSANFAVSSLVLQRFDLRNLVRGAQMLTRVGLVALFFWVMPPQLWHVAAGFAISGAVNFIGDVLLWRRLTPQLHVTPADSQRQRMRELLGLSGWAVLNQVGMLLLMQADLVIVNNLFGPVLTGAYGSLLLFPQLIITLAETVISILSPAIMSHYAKGDLAGLRAYTLRSLRLIGLALALPIGLLCGFGGALLVVWLGPEFLQYHLLLVVLVGHLGANLGARPLAYVITAFNKMRVQALWTIGLGVASILLAISLALWSPLGAVGVALASALTWTLKNFTLLPLYSARLLELQRRALYKPLFTGLLGGLAVGLASWGLTFIWWPANWFQLGLAAALVSVAYLFAVYAVCLQDEDRQLLWSVLRRHNG